MTDERVYEAERALGVNTWEFVGNFTVTDWTLGSSFEKAAQENDWPAGDYRLSNLDETRVSGSFYLYTLKVRSDPVYEAMPTAILESLA